MTTTALRTGLVLAMALLLQVVVAPWVTIAGVQVDLLLLVALVAPICALLPNATTVILVAPIILSVCRALKIDFVTFLPYAVMIGVVLVSGYVQQWQIQGRSQNQQNTNPQQQMIMKILPAFIGVISFGLPGALVLYFVTSNLFRVGQQWDQEAHGLGVSGSGPTLANRLGQHLQGEHAPLEAARRPTVEEAVKRLTEPATQARSHPPGERRALRVGPVAIGPPPP